MQRATPSWIAEAAARAEERSRITSPHQTPIKALEQFNVLIAAIMDPRFTRGQLREMARLISDIGGSQ